jgi:hypothetical protein
MASTNRQNKLLAAEDWKKIYQTFKNADFQSYDFDNLRRTMISYLRDNYPEDFNDYIESSEYLALIDLIAFLGQNLAYRYDLNSRDNFLELAERRESILRLARLLSYNPKRTISANGLLKFTSVSTTETIIDSNGRNLSGQNIVWNDPANVNWYEQFIKVINAAIPETSQFGKPQIAGTVSGVKCESYRFNSSNNDLPVYAFSKPVDGRNTNFEIVSTTFVDRDKIYEEPPLKGNSPAFLFRDDGQGPASSNTGFFMLFKQGTLNEGNFNIPRPGQNEAINIDSFNINNDDVWLYSLDSSNNETNLWTKVDSVEGNNIIFNSVNKNIKNIFSVLTRTADRISLVFADGTFGNLPQGTFKVYYRTSNGLTYVINPTDIRNIAVDISYFTKTGKAETLTITMALKYTINNAAASESSESIRENAPATYYTQGRMITGEDYNVLPLSVSQEIIKAKSVNRTSSGISRYFDLRDASGKYSYTNLLGADGILYKEDFLDSFVFNYNTRSDIENVIVNFVQPLFRKSTVKDFYLDKFPKIGLADTGLRFFVRTEGTNITTGYIGDQFGAGKKLGSFTASNLKYLIAGSMVKFVPGEGKMFLNGQIVNFDPSVKGSTQYIWSKIVRLFGDGTGGSLGILQNGEGPVTINDIIPNGALIESVIPKFSLTIENAVKDRMSDLIFSGKEFALRYDISSTSWKIISSANIDKKTGFSLGREGDLSSSNADSSWIILFETDGEKYTVSYRNLRYVFESSQEIRFYFDASDKIYDAVTGNIIKDTITVLGVNSDPNSPSPMSNNFQWQIVEDYKASDGYVDTKKISISFYDVDEDGIVDDPDLFLKIVDPLTNPTSKIIFQKRQVGLDGVFDYYYFDNTDNFIKVYQTQDDVLLDLSNLKIGQLVYVINENLVKQYNGSTQPFTINSEYKGFFGRSKLKFQYIHAADSDVRLDPSTSNIVDVYLLTRSYDTDMRNWIAGITPNKPLPLSSDNLFVNFGNKLNSIKSISDEIIYHPVKYKVLFGNQADSSLRATFKIVKNSNIVISDNDIKVLVIDAINEFFSIENWEFGDTFYFAELSAYIMKKATPNISNIVLVPKSPSLSFGSLLEIKSNSDEIFISSATVEDVEIISEITAARLQASGVVLTRSNNNQSVLGS